MSEIHICLLSDQLLPNLIPILMERPVCVYLVATPEMVKRGRDVRMRRLLRHEKIEPRIREGAPSTGIDKIRAFAEKLTHEIVKDKDSAGRTLVLNATGGTKLLSMGFVEVFRAHLEGYPLRVIYTDTEHQVLETLVPRGLDATPMGGVLRVESYLAAQGMTFVSAMSDDLEWRSVVQERCKLTVYLANECERLGGFLGMLNGLVHGTGRQSGALASNGGELLHPEQRLNRSPRGLYREVLKRVADVGLIQWVDAKTVRFNTVEAARYLGGHWLEEYAWLVADAAGLQDARCSATVRWELQSGPEAPTNEFDLLAVHNNRLLLVECKTGQQAAGEQAVATRLESLSRNAGGLFGLSLLVSARALPTTMRNRCQSLGIRLLEQGEVKRLADYVDQWRDTGALTSR